MNSTSEANCRNWGETIWEQCWWVNNVKWITAVVFVALWFGPLYLLYRKYPDTVIGSLVGLAWLFIGGFVSLAISFLIVHPLLLAIVGG